MLSSEEYIYLHDDNAQGFLKYYKGGKYAFMGILPNENVSVEDYLANLDGETFTNLYNNRITGRGMELYVHIPEFTVEDSYDLKSTLQDLGITTAFDPFSADFGNMISSTRGNVYIDSVTQKTFIQVDRNGTKASAVTDLEASDCAVMPEPKDIYYVYLNRPFIYAIVDTDTGLPVFMGTVNSIAQ
jgi:serpin B